MSRSNVLFQIERSLAKRGVNASIRSVEDFRSLFPGYQGVLTIEGLYELLREIPNADLDAWRAPPKAKKPGPKRSHKIAISEEEIIRLRSEGVKVPTIAELAKVTRSRIYQILNKEWSDLSEI